MPSKKKETEKTEKTPTPKEVRKYHVLGFRCSANKLLLYIASTLCIIIAGILYQDDMMFIVPIINMMAQDTVSDTIGAEWFYKDYEVARIEDCTITFKMVGRDDHYFEYMVEEDFSGEYPKYTYVYMKFWIKNTDGTRTVWKIDNFNLKAKITVAPADKNKDLNIYDKHHRLYWITVEDGYVFEPEIIESDSERSRHLAMVERLYVNKVHYSDSLKTEI